MLDVALKLKKKREMEGGGFWFCVAFHLRLDLEKW